MENREIGLYIRELEASPENIKILYFDVNSCLFKEHEEQYKAYFCIRKEFSKELIFHNFRQINLIIAIGRFIQPILEAIKEYLREKRTHAYFQLILYTSNDPWVVANPCMRFGAKFKSEIEPFVRNYKNSTFNGMEFEFSYFDGINPRIIFFQLAPFLIPEENSPEDILKKLIEHLRNSIELRKSENEPLSFSKSELVYIEKRIKTHISIFELFCWDTCIFHQVNNTLKINIDLIESTILKQFKNILFHLYFHATYNQILKISPFLFAVMRHFAAPMNQNELIYKKVWKKTTFSEGTINKLNQSEGKQIIVNSFFVASLDSDYNYCAPSNGIQTHIKIVHPYRSNNSQIFPYYKGGWCFYPMGSRFTIIYAKTKYNKFQIKLEYIPSILPKCYTNYNPLKIEIIGPGANLEECFMSIVFQKTLNIIYNCSENVQITPIDAEKLSIGIALKETLADEFDKLRMLTLDNTQLGECQCQSFCNVLKECRSLVSLTISHNNLSGGQGIENIADLITHHDSLKKLKLDHDALNDDDCNIIKKMMRKRKKELDNVVQRPSNLEELILDNNHIRRKGLLRIIKAFEENLVIKILSFQKNKFTSIEQFQLVCAAAKKLEDQVKIDLSNNETINHEALKKEIELNEVSKKFKTI